MRYHYTNLGAVPAVASRETERRDEMLARTGAAAREIMRRLRRLPAGKKVEAMDRVLGRFDPGLPTRVRRVAAYLSDQGMKTDMAVERALALSLADATIEKIKRMGIAARRGEPLAGVFGSLGATPSASETQAEQSAEDVVVGLVQGVVCSNALQSSVTDLVGRNEGSDAASATNVGFEVGQGVAQCQQRTTTPTPTTPTPAPSDSGSSLVVPIAVGVGAVAVLGGAYLLMRKK